MFLSVSVSRNAAVPHYVAPLGRILLIDSCPTALWALLEMKRFGVFITQHYFEQTSPSINQSLGQSATVLQAVCWWRC